MVGYLHFYEGLHGHEQYHAVAVESSKGKPPFRLCMPHAQASNKVPKQPLKNVVIYRQMDQIRGDFGKSADDTPINVIAGTQINAIIPA